MTTEAAVSPPREPFLILPGFAPDAVGFALRATFALLLAYFIAFWIQLDSASSAGLCVAIVAQASPGMAMSKALYRIAGTVIGGAVALVVVSAFGQDRTLLLGTFTLWLGACTFVAAILRDFRSYGAVLSGYTVGIIAIASIDAPQGALLTTLDRVAAILLGVACVALSNTLLARNVAFETLVAGLRQKLADISLAGRRALAGDAPPDAMASVQHAAAILALSTQASYAATELPDGSTRAAGAREAIAALLAMLSAARAVAAVRAAAPREDAAAQGAEPEAALSNAAAADDLVPDAGVPDAATPRDAFIVERVAAMAQQERNVEAGLHTLEFGWPTATPVHLRTHYDTVGAALSAGRTVIAVGLCSVFCVFAGWPGVTSLLVQQAAFTALLGMQPNPSRAGVLFGLALPVPAIAAGIVGFVLLPGVSGFGPFALAVAPCFFVFALLSHHPRTAAFGPGLMLYFTLLLAPSNTETFDLASYINLVLQQIVAVLFMVLGFRLILPVSPKRRLARVADAIVRDLRRTMRRGGTLDAAATQSLKYDRLTQGLLWLGRPTPARVAVFERLLAFAELDTALRRAWSGLDAARHETPGLGALLESARSALLQPNPAPLETAALALLAHPDSTHPAAMRAVSGMFGAHILLVREARALRHYRIVRE